MKILFLPEEKPSRNIDDRNDNLNNNHSNATTLSNWKWAYTIQCDRGLDREKITSGTEIIRSGPRQLRGQVKYHFSALAAAGLSASTSTSIVKWFSTRHVKRVKPEEEAQWIRKLLQSMNAINLGDSYNFADERLSELSELSNLLAAKANDPTSDPPP